MATFDEPRPRPRWSLHDVRLKVARDGAGGYRLDTKPRDCAASFVVQLYDDRNHAALDHAKFFGDRSIKKICLVSSDTKVVKDRPGIEPLSSKTPINLAEEVRHGRRREQLLVLVHHAGHVPRQSFDLGRRRIVWCAEHGEDALVSR